MTTAMKRVVLGVLGTALLCSADTNASVFSFFDGTFNPGDLTFQVTAQSNQSVNSAQSLTGGNPGGAFEFDAAYGVGLSMSQANILENRFVYDPGAGGAVTTIAYSADVFATGVVSLNSNGETLLIHQGTRDYFSTFASVPPVVGAYNTASLSGLTAANFTASDGTHPNFTSGLMEFGFVQGLTVTGISAAGTFVSRVDNFSVSLNVTPNAVPEPADATLVPLGLALMATITVCRRGRT